MRKKCFSLIAGFMVVLVGIPCPSHAEVTLHYTHPLGSAGDLSLTAKGQTAAMKFPLESRESRIVFHQSTGRMYLVFDHDRTYLEVDALVQSLGGLSDLLGNIMPQLSADLQGQMENLLKPSGSRNGSSPEITPTGEQKQILGRSCRIFLVRWADSLAEMCTASPADLGISRDDFLILRELIVQQTAHVRQLETALGIRVPDLGFETMDRIPLRVRQKSGPHAGSGMTLRRIDPEADPQMVTIPSDYQLVSLLGK